jgi:hypothetical protein
MGDRLIALPAGRLMVVNPLHLFFFKVAHQFFF